MNTSKRPIAVLILSSLYIVVGTVGFIAHFHLHELVVLQYDSLLVELTELLAVISGAFMLRGCNWARWLAVIWMAFHVAISFPVVREVVIHSIIFVLIAWILFRSDGRRYFMPSQPDYK